MKRIFLVMAAILTVFIACEKEPEEKQTLSCEITSPIEGSEIDLKETNSIKIICDAKASIGSVSSVQIMVNGKQVAESATVPFTHEYTFDKDQTEGNMDIELKAEGDQGATASDKVSVRLFRTEDPQVINCELTAPEDGMNIEIPTMKTIKISGNGKAETGSISKVTLKFGEMLVEKVTGVPFEIDYAIPETLPEGEYIISLDIKGDKGAEAHDEVKVNITEKEQIVNCSITAPVDGSEIMIPSTNAITVSGEGSADYGEISEVSLKIGNKAIEEVKELPFNINYTLPENLEEGELVISLNVKGNKGAVAKDQIKLNIVKEDVPQPGENEFIDPRDGKVYKTVTINDQVWFAQNLAYLPEVSLSETANQKDGKQRYYVLNYEGEDVAAAKATEEYTTYGVLYNWNAAMGQDNATSGDPDAIPSGIQGACPEGWHIPSLAEWKKMEEYVASQLPDVKGNGMYIDLGFGDPYWEFEDGLRNVWSAVAAAEGWGQTSMGDENPDLKFGPRNTFGLSIAPSGQCYQTGGFGLSESNADFWHTLLQDNGGGVTTFTNMSYRPQYSKFGSNIRRGYSVRCIKD